MLDARLGQGLGHQLHEALLLQLQEARLAEKYGFADNVLERNVFYYTDPEATLFSGRPFTPDVLRVDHNVYYCPGTKEPVIRAGGADTWQEWLAKGFDAHSLLADPKFADAEHDDYTLAADSPALALGFVPIDTSGVGPRARD